MCLRKLNFCCFSMATGDVDWAGAADAQEKSLVKQVGTLDVNGTEELNPAERSLLQV